MFLNIRPIPTKIKGGMMIKLLL